MVTQAEGSSGPLAASLAALGAEPLALPTIAIEPPDDWGPLDEELERLERFDWIVFTSRHAVEAVTGRPAWSAARERDIPGLRVAAVGKATARALAGAGVTADLVPDEPGGGELARLIASLGGSTDSGARSDPSRPLAGLHILWPRSEIALREVPESLHAAGAEIVDPIAYRNVLPSGSNVEAIARRLLEGSIDAVTFMSPSGARNLSALLGWPDLRPLARCAVVASIGPTTTEALRELGAPPDVESSARTADDLARTLLAYLELH